MAVMAMYCKAYPLARLREYRGWTEHPGSLAVRQDATADTGDTGETAPSGEPDYVFLQENLTVTNGVFVDENVVFDAVTPEWETFCRTTLEFEVPPYEVKTPVQDGDGAA
jgi:hypothetical protein